MPPMTRHYCAMALKVLVGSMFLAIVPVQAAHAAEDNPLGAERWKTRPVVVVVPATGHALIRRIEAALAEPAAREAFIERDMVLYTIEAGEGRRNGKPIDGSRTRAVLAALDLDANGPPTFVLVGKDGGVKLQEGADVDLQAVFAEIDRMPMRRK